VDQDTSPAENGVRATKRAVDVVVSSVALFLLAPIIPVVMLVIRATSKGPALYSTRRIGVGGREVNVVRFRTMFLGAEHEPTSLTPIGRFVDRNRLQLLPQLWNVIRGDLTLGRPRRGGLMRVRRPALWKISPRRTGQSPARARGTRRLGAGRPAARRTSSSSASRDGPDSDDPEPGPGSGRLLLLVDHRWGRVNLPLLRTLRAVVE
jgi:hypothetical protein